MSFRRDMKLNIDEESRQAMVGLQKSNPFFSRAPSSSGLTALPSHTAKFLGSSSPPYRPKLREMSPPLFAREKRQNCSGSRDERFELKRFKEVDVPESDIDFAKESMAVIDGWSMSSRFDLFYDPIFDIETAVLQNDASSDESKTPSLSSDKSEIDEIDDGLWLPSSSEAGDATRYAEEMKMGESVLTGTHFSANLRSDVPLFPRSERPGGGVKSPHRKTQRCIFTSLFLRNSDLLTLRQSL